MVKVDNSVAVTSGKGRSGKKSKARQELGKSPEFSNGDWVLGYVNTEEAQEMIPVPSPVPFRAKQTKFTRRFQLNDADGFLSSGTGYIEAHPRVNGAVVFTNGAAEAESTMTLNGWASFEMDKSISSEQNMVGGHMVRKCEGKASSDAAWDNVISYPITASVGATVTCHGVIKATGKHDVPTMSVVIRFYTGGAWSAWTVLKNNVSSANPDYEVTGVSFPAGTTRVAYGLKGNSSAYDYVCGLSWSMLPTTSGLGCGLDSLVLQTHDVDSLTDVPDLVGWRCTGLSMRVFQTGTLTTIGGVIVGAQVPTGFVMDDDPISSLSRYPVDKYIGSFSDQSAPGLHLWWRPQSLDDFELNTALEPHRASSYLCAAFDVVDTSTTVNVQIDMLFDYQSFNQLHVGRLTPPAHDLFAYLYVLGLVDVASCNNQHKDKGTMARALSSAKRALGMGVNYALQHPEKVAAALATLAAL